MLNTVSGGGIDTGGMDSSLADQVDNTLLPLESQGFQCLLLCRNNRLNAKVVLKKWLSRWLYEDYYGD